MQVDKFKTHPKFTEKNNEHFKKVEWNKGWTRTGLKPPGGLVLAQLQFGNLHCVASHE